MKDEPIGTDDFAKRLSDFSLLRGNDVLDSNQQTIQVQQVDVIAPPLLSTSTKKERFVTLAGFDRNFQSDKSRYEYTINVNGYDYGISSFKNVLSLAATCVIIPMDATRSLTAATVAGSIGQNTDATFFGYPYLTLNIDNLQTVEGTNDALRNAFAVLKYDRSYRAQNGRGYIILKPVQEEVKVFHPAPLASLNNLHLSLMKPNGVLLSNTQDDYRIEYVEYEAFNRLYVKLVTDKYFDKNEFFLGDNVYVRNCTVQPPSIALADFLNRPEGHDVVQLGQPNDQNFYKTFYILAPGVLDQDAGKITIDADIVDAIQASTTVNGAIINASLQLVVSMKVTVATTDIPSNFGLI